MKAELTRRDLIKAQAVAVAASAAGLAAPAVAQPVSGGVGALEIKWSKAPCRFCGTGCGVMVGVKDGHVVATHGDMQAEDGRSSGWREEGAIPEGVNLDRGGCHGRVLFMDENEDGRADPDWIITV